VEYQRRIARDRHTGKLAEIDIHELPPVREAEPGRSYAFKRGEEVPADHEAVLDAPGHFREAPREVRPEALSGGSTEMGPVCRPGRNANPRPSSPPCHLVAACASGEALTKYDLPPGAYRVPREKLGARDPHASHFPPSVTENLPP
jgi:hypothetical protein